MLGSNTRERRQGESGYVHGMLAVEGQAQIQTRNPEK